MKTASAGVVTARGVRDGDPRALAALCERRGSAVLAYCEELLSGTAVKAAAADAFARFRQEVVAANRLDSVNPEALLLRSTRRAALARVTPVVAGTRSLRGIVRARGETCSLVPELLAAHAEEQLSNADEERLARHLTACSACHDLAERFMRAEHAYRDPPDRSVPADLVSTIVAAAAAASPAPNGDPAPVDTASAASNGEPVPSSYRANGGTASEPKDAPERPRRQPSRADEAPTVVVPALELSADDDEEVPSRASLLLTGDFALRVLTPGFVVAVGVVVALAIAGVFSSSKQGSDTAHSPASVPAPVGGATLVAASHAPASTVPDNLAREAKLAQEKRRAAEEAARAARAAKQANPPAVETTPSAGTTSPPAARTVTPRTTPAPTRPKRYSAQKVQKRTTKRPPPSPSSPSPSGTQTTPGGATPGN